MDFANILQYEVHDVRRTVSSGGTSYGIDVTVSNNGTAVVIVVWIKIRFCIKPSAAGRRVCFSTVFSTRIEIDGQALERLTLHPGDARRVTLRADVPPNEWERRKGFEEVELAVFETSERIGLMREISLS